MLKEKTSVIQAIAQAGGFGQFASRNNIIVIRAKTSSSATEEKFNIRFKDIIDANFANSSNMILRPGDTIFVP